MIYPLNGSNIYAASALTGISVAELAKKKNEAMARSIDEKNRQYSLNFLDKDEQWYEEAMLKIEAIKSKLPKEMHHKEKTIRLYGWIADTIDRNLTIPMESDNKYARALSVELLLTNLELYEKILRWE